MKFYSLISEDGESISKGCIAWWIALGLMIYFWTFLDIKSLPPSLYEVFCVLTAYNFGKKVSTPFADYLSSKIPAK